MFKMHEKDKQLNNLKSYRYFLFCGNIFFLFIVCHYIFYCSDKTDAPVLWGH